MNSSSSVTRILVAATLLAAAPFAHGQENPAPNIILIFADDQGWNHLSVPMDDELPGSGSDYFQTPNILRIAASGMRFPNAYASAPMCGPSRIALHYGKGTAQVVYSEAAEDVRAESMTIGEMMQAAGYATAHFGKWSPGAPESGLQHYDESDGNAGNGAGNVDDTANPKDIFGITERAVAFMEASVDAGQPFYMQLSHYAPHVGFQALEETLEKWQRIEPGEIHTDPVYGAMTEDLDTGIGRVLDKVQELGAEDNTYVIYTSDHGQTINRSTNQPLRLGKGTLWEGGVRVPFIVRWPGRVPAGGVSAEMAATLDIYQTLLSAAGVETPAGGDGHDLTALWEGSARQSPRREFIYHRGSRAQGIRVGPWKLRTVDGDELFQLDVDSSERYNVAGEHPEIVAELRDRLSAFEARVAAETASGE